MDRLPKELLFQLNGYILYGNGNHLPFMQRRVFILEWKHMDPSLRPISLCIGPFEFIRWAPFTTVRRDIGEGWPLQLVFDIVD
jgi:hypothetical protein